MSSEDLKEPLSTRLVGPDKAALIANAETLGSSKDIVLRELVRAFNSACEGGRRPAFPFTISSPAYKVKGRFIEDDSLITDVFTELPRHLDELEKDCHEKNWGGVLNGVAVLKDIAKDIETWRAKLDRQHESLMSEMPGGDSAKPEWGAKLKKDEAHEIKKKRLKKAE